MFDRLSLDMLEEWYFRLMSSRLIPLDLLRCWRCLHGHQILHSCRWSMCHFLIQNQIHNLLLLLCLSLSPRLIHSRTDHLLNLIHSQTNHFLIRFLIHLSQFRAEPE